MNLIFRLLLLLIRSRRLQQIDPQQLAYFNFKVLPTDCDFNLHLTNSRYTSVLDLARTQYLMQVGAGRAILFKGWVAVLAGQSISFFKEIKPFSRVTVTTQVVYWDRRFCYIEHKFLVKGQLHARALAKVVLIRARRVRAFDKFIEFIRPDIEAPEAPQITPQIEAFKELLAVKKNS